MELATSYDKNSDVLYISLGKPQASETVEQQDGLLFRYANKDRAPSGVTVLDYKTAWSANRATLTDRIADFLKAPRDVVGDAVADCLRPGSPGSTALLRRSPGA
jgi:hypothetical protein